MGDGGGAGGRKMRRRYTGTLDFFKNTSKESFF